MHLYKLFYRVMFILSNLIHIFHYRVLINPGSLYYSKKMQFPKRASVIKNVLSSHSVAIIIIKIEIMKTRTILILK